MGSGAKSYMRKVFLTLRMRKCTNIFTIYEEEVVSHMTLHPIPLNFLIYMRKFNFLFYQCSDYLWSEESIISLSGFH